MGFSRRRFLTVCGSSISAFAGCVTQLRGCDGLEEREGIASLEGVSLPVPQKELLKAGPTDGIRAIVKPAFISKGENPDKGSSANRNQLLFDDDLVVGVVRDGQARAYSLSILFEHEIVNDNFGGPLLATYCPVCGSSVTAERVVDGEPTIFGVSGYLWRGDLVMYDQLSRSLWSQIIATAIRGPRVGDHLSLIPSTLTTWKNWRDQHPDTDLLLPPPNSRTLGQEPNTYRYLPYESSQLFPDETRRNSTRNERTIVLGIVVEGRARAYSFSKVKEERVINDRLNGHPILVVLGAGKQLIAYDRCVNGRTLSFTVNDKILMQGDGSNWRIGTGVAIDGPHKGTRLTRIVSRPPMYWHAWRNFYPQTDRYGATGN